MGAAITAPLAAMAHGFVASMAEMGGAVNGRDAANATRYVSALQRLSQAMVGLRDAIGSAVLPLMSQWPEALARIISGATDWVRQNQGLIVMLAKFGSILIAAGTALMFVGKGISMLGSVFGGMATITSTVASAVGLLGSLLAALATPMGLVIAGALAIGGAIFVMSGAAEESLAWLADGFASLKDDALAAWKGIGDALATGNIGLAAKIVWLTLKMEWQKGINTINQAWIGAKNFFMSTWSNAVYGVASIFTDGWAMVESGWVETVDFLRDAWSVFTNFLSKTWNNTIGFVQKAWVRLKALFDEDIDVNAEVNRINNETNAKNTEADTARDSAIAERDQQRKKSRKDIEDRRQGTQRELADQQARDDEERQKKYDAQSMESQAAVDAAKEEFRGATQEAATGRAEYERKQRDRRYPGQITSTLNTEQKKLESKGTFNAMAARGLGADSLADRTAKATESTAKSVSELLNEARKGGVVFA